MSGSHVRPLFSLLAWPVATAATVAWGGEAGDGSGPERCPAWTAGATLGDQAAGEVRATVLSSKADYLALSLEGHLAQCADFCTAEAAAAAAEVSATSSFETAVCSSRRLPLAGHCALLLLLKKARPGSGSGSGGPGFGLGLSAARALAETAASAAGSESGWGPQVSRHVCRIGSATESTGFGREVHTVTDAWAEELQLQVGSTNATAGSDPSSSPLDDADVWLLFMWSTFAICVLALIFSLTSVCLLFHVLRQARELQGTPQRGSASRRGPRRRAATAVTLAMPAKPKQQAVLEVEMVHMAEPEENAEKEGEERVFVGCPKRSDPRLREVAYPSPSISYKTKFPPLIFIPSGCKLLAGCNFVTFTVLCVTVFKEPLEFLDISWREVLKYLSLPVVSVAFTYGHIWLALWMTFYPTEFVGVKGCQCPDSPFGLGWQGIIPSKARKMGARFINQITETLLSLQEIVARVDPDALLEHLKEPLAKEVAAIVDELGTQEAPEVWNLMPQRVKEELILKLTEDMPLTVQALFKRVKAEINDLFDIEEFVVETMVHNKPLFSDAFVTQAVPEIEFIRDCGGYMGAFFGFVQMVQQFFYPAGWLLPVFGVGVGLLTNWMALKMTFEPIYPKELWCGIVVQGCFLKRQAEFAPGYAKFFSEHLARTSRLVPGILAGRRSDRLCEVIHEELNAGIDRCSQAVQPLIRLTGCGSNYTRFKETAIEKLSDRLPDLFLKAERHIDESLDLEKILTERVRGMDVAEFENLLHPIFKEDEWILILVGGLLGYVVGSAQWWILGT